MRLSEFNRAVADEFGAAYGRQLVRDLVIVELGGRTCEQALAAGVPARDVWLALCEATDVPAERRHGAGLPDPKKH
ncbi:DUF3046 domain-containing protein [Gryllotalpicola ginsengisoli]|uniref:DUF3046 domain-containing protein n=1 Tax=Gryllotalpicola ginsengisoli TaxID=444608 RepID=UPI0003B4935D|nr:DUF3046 domain-containing protein [Gryllotalpicola ginsengisoli]